MAKNERRSTFSDFDPTWGSVPTLAGDVSSDARAATYPASRATAMVKKTYLCL
jgi:hypothetical protein